MIFADAAETRVQEIGSELNALFGQTLTGLSWERYYKFAGCYTISFYLPTSHREQPDTTAFLQSITSRLASGWTLSPGKDAADISAHAIWNPGPDSQFRFPETRFAYIDLVHPDLNAKYLAEFVPTPLE